MNAKEALKTYFGYDSFKPGQEEIISAILSGQDVLAIMPTGSGKSICYEVPALLLPGITIVISPLISLMQDQVKALNDSGIRAGYINSSLTNTQISKVYSLASQGAFKILYVSPERLESFRFADFANQMEISMVTVDEAHCISQWGQDFRPSYLKIVEFIDSLPKRPVVGSFTATATEEVKTDIACVLKLRNPKVVVTGFDRANLFFDVETTKKKDAYVLKYVREHSDESGIIYCATRKNVDSLYDQLCSEGIAVARYHAGMSNGERKRNQDDFIYDRSPVIVATNAFGMGIDKSNVRYVLHYNMPQSMENYYQEAGRAGRDGEPSQCILLFSPQDIMINKFLLAHKDFSEIDVEDVELIRQRDAKRLRIIEGYCRTSDCLRNYILQYFGEHRDDPCDNCGNCSREFTEIDMTEEAKQIINCVYETKGRYGINIVLGTVLGANRARLKELGTDHYKTYGILKNHTEQELRQLVNQMLLEGYLYQTTDQYSVVRMGNIMPLKNPENRVRIRAVKDSDPEPAASSRRRRNTDTLTKAGYHLFDDLRRLRLTIAREEGMPPYIIFSDKTLIDMSARTPLTKEAMLNVSGVGQAKYEKYGERFIKAVRTFLEDNPEAVTSIVDEETSPENAPKTQRTRKTPKTPKEPFYLNPEDAGKYEYRELALVTEIKDELNRITSAENVKHVFGTDIFRLLVSLGYVEERQEDGRSIQVQTEQGLAKGIVSVEKTSKLGNVYTVLMYPEAVQREVLEYFVGQRETMLQ